MDLSNQSIASFAFLVLTGAVLASLTGLLLFDVRGALDAFVARLQRTYAKPAYQRAFVYTQRQRDLYADAPRMRRTARLVAGLGFTMGIVILLISLVALVNGHVH